VRQLLQLLQWTAALGRIIFAKNQLIKNPLKKIKLLYASLSRAAAAAAAAVDRSLRQNHFC
jgi:hypothetical protein